MERKQPSPETVDAYIQRFPEDIRIKLEAIRATIKAVVPDAKEKISYQMPGFSFHGPLVYFAAFQNHIGFYPTPNGIEEFKSDLAKYRQGKGSVQFPVDQEMPLELIARITAYRAEENTRKEQERKK